MEQDEEALVSEYDELKSMVRRYRTDDAEESRHQFAFLDFLGKAKAPFDRKNFTPGHVTGSGFVLDPDGRAALIFHERFLWVQPGGHAEPGETDPMQIAARETKEELGVPVNLEEMELFDLDVHQIPRFGEEPPHKHFDMRFLIPVPDCDLTPGGDAVDARWFTRSELASTGLDAGMRRMADKAVSRRLLTP